MTNASRTGLESTHNISAVYMHQVSRMRPIARQASIFLFGLSFSGQKIERLYVDSTAKICKFSHFMQVLLIVSSIFNHFNLFLCVLLNQFRPNLRAIAALDTVIVYSVSFCLALCAVSLAVVFTVLVVHISILLHYNFHKLYRSRGQVLLSNRNTRHPRPPGSKYRCSIWHRLELRLPLSLCNA